MYVVMTRVRLLPGKIAECAALFKQTNPGLVKDEPAWLGARMMFDEMTNIVTVLATWSDLQAYEDMSARSAFQETMKEFSAYFDGPPEITTHTVFVEMTP